MNASLYAPEFEHDSCGFGLLAQIDGRASGKLVERAFAALARLSHRGAVNADGISGDGCGVLLHGCNDWLRALAQSAGIELGERFAAGLVFLDPAADASAGEILERRLVEEGVQPAGWREVAVNPDACGPIAVAGQPRVRQIFVNAAAGMSARAFERALFRARRRAECAFDPAAACHVLSLSAHAIVYKAMAAPGRLRDVYPDLAHPALAADAVVFHQRFSTNTAPDWRLAQPFRVLAHNGEINTIAGNRRWMNARAPLFASPELRLDDLGPPVTTCGSDSQSLDNALELLLAGGVDMLEAIRILVPPAWRARRPVDEALNAFHAVHAAACEPWDGPAALVMCDGDYAACALDRNGLRPARWALSDDNHLLVASEAGLWDFAAARIKARGRLGPGQMLAVDFRRRRLLHDANINAINRARAPFAEWLRDGLQELSDEVDATSVAAMPSATLHSCQKLYGLTREECEWFLKVMGETGKGPVGAMGDDTPMAALSQHVRSLYDYVRQGFAQVTNPPIDPLRERQMMSLVVRLGANGNPFVFDARRGEQVTLPTPLLSDAALQQLLALPRFAGRVAVLDLCANEGETLAAAIDSLCQRAVDAARGGAALICLSDRQPRAGVPPIPALAATGAVHARLLAERLRCSCHLLIDTGTLFDAHHFACLIGFGATAVCPWLAWQTLQDMHARGEAKHADGLAGVVRNYRHALASGLLKVMSKSGIATASGYRGTQLFEIVGLAREVVDKCFPGTPSRVAGAGFAELDADRRTLTAAAWDAGTPIELGGVHRFIHGGEYHMFNPEVVDSLQDAVRSGDPDDYRRFARQVNKRPASTLRDLLRLREAPEPIALGEVEPAASILARFDSAAMSLGALSPEAHETLAIAMNRLGGRSNSGEGGEDPSRHGTERTSRIKQVASARFGVTPEYLVNAEVLQIKVAQGAKPGEGGQLPGFKVNEMIARLRHASPGTELISPPPHHDIYSIEDLAQLIHDLKQVNPRAQVSVKLVSHAGVGTVAAGVVKAGADFITLSGHDGGTGASPLESIHHAGTPWELGLSEVRQTLVRHGLRQRVRLQADGGMKTGLDVIKAAILGADSFGFGTAPMVALGCRYLRICHLNNCATGIATQHEALRRDHFIGLPEMVMNYFRFVAEDVRHWLARLGARSLDEVIGRTEWLAPGPVSHPRQACLDILSLLADADATPATRFGSLPRPLVPETASLCTRIHADTADVVGRRRGGQFNYTVTNTDRSVGARLSGEVARHWGDAGMADAPIELQLSGSAGQSLGAWNAGGVHIRVQGEANDYVGKGMAGGSISLRPPSGAGFACAEHVIMGNTCLYGATGGELFAAGSAGERFAVRNSGAHAVVEGVGDHGCEYMTGGVVVVLGRTGINFGAGMTGGYACVLDADGDFAERCNPDSITMLRLSGADMDAPRHRLRQLLERHVALTGSRRGRRVLADFEHELQRFWMVAPRNAQRARAVGEADAGRRVA
ncbi:MAG TPA: glutamate synthase large subunit [Rhodanobacteraceae bacterium]|nr:glutamate synthase large subunit [Rhodanobacteraceae bacterium]